MNAKLFLTIVIAISFFFLFTSFLGFYMSIKPPRISSPVTPERFGLEYENIKIETSDNILLSGWFIPVTGTKTNKTIIGLHGYPADKGNILPIVAEFSEEFNLLLFDFRYFGESEGSYSTAGIKEKEDLLAAIKYLKEKGYEDIGLWGFSMGGAVALMTPEETGVRSIAAHSSYANLPLLSSELYRIPVVDKLLGELTIEWARVVLGINAREMSPINSASSSTIPIIIIHSRSDNVISFKHAELLQKTLAENENAKFLFEEDLLHGQVTDETTENIKEFFRETL